MSNQTNVQHDATPWDTMFQAIKDALTGKPHNGQHKTVTFGNKVTIDDPFGGHVSGGYQVTVENHVDTPPAKR